MASFYSNGHGGKHLFLMLINCKQRAKKNLKIELGSFEDMWK